MILYLTVKFVILDWESAHRWRNIHVSVSWECLPKQSVQICLSVQWRCLKIFDLASASGCRRVRVSFSPMPCWPTLHVFYTSLLLPLNHVFMSSWVKFHLPCCLWQKLTPQVLRQTLKFRSFALQMTFLLAARVRSVDMKLWALTGVETLPMWTVGHRKVFRWLNQVVSILSRVME